MPPTPTVVLGTPLKGVVRTISREEPEPQTLISSLNVLPYGPQDGFRRLSQRAGVALFGTTHSTVPVQGMLPFGYILQPGAVIGNGSFAPFAISNFSTGGGASTVGSTIFFFSPGGGATASTNVSSPANPGTPSTSTSVVQWDFSWVPGSTGSAHFGPFTLSVGNANTFIFFGYVSTVGPNLFAAIGRSLSTPDIVPLTFAGTTGGGFNGVPQSVTITMKTTGTQLTPSGGTVTTNVVAGNVTTSGTVPFTGTINLSPLKAVDGGSFNVPSTSISLS